MTERVRVREIDDDEGRRRSFVSLLDFAMGVANPIQGMRNMATGNTFSGAYTRWVAGHGINTSSNSTYIGGTWAGFVLQMAVGGLFGAVRSAAAALGEEAAATAAEDAGMLARLPVFVKGGKTSGILVGGGDEIPLTSGYSGPAINIPRGTPGFNIITRAHVEGQATAIMRQQGLDEATLYINNVPCPGVQGCDYLLPRMLPEGSQLRVVGPNGFDKIYYGLPDYVFARP